MNKMVVELPAGIDAALGHIAERTGRSCPDLVIEALFAFLDEQQRTDPSLDYPLPLSVGIASNPELNARDIDEWLAQNWDPEADWRRE